MSKPEDGSDNKWVAFETSGLFALGLADRSEEDVGRKELVGFTDGARESAQDWRDLLLDLKRRGSTCRRGSPSPMTRSGSEGRR